MDESKDRMEREAAIAMAKMLLRIDNAPETIKISSRIVLVDLPNRFANLTGGVMHGFSQGYDDLDEANTLVEYLELVSVGLDSFLEAHPALAKLMDEVEHLKEGGKTRNVGD